MFRGDRYLPPPEKHLLFILNNPFKKGHAVLSLPLIGREKHQAAAVFGFVRQSNASLTTDLAHELMGHL